ncbi:hypothetical protein KOR42_02810 [Thalassoglobus neptunius]|uniref:Uncharacterized protein n=1 Tax=Thalassoglobus neptunius TaxID=1938619 RepID=A0A5C5X413_9PLAN|nr:hypothetical protein KOR42_02810 [Thalassoglobus neptunius]
MRFTEAKPIRPQLSNSAYQEPGPEIPNQQFRAPASTFLNTHLYPEQPIKKDTRNTTLIGNGLTTFKKHIQLFPFRPHKMAHPPLANTPLRHSNNSRRTVPCQASS